MKSSFIIPSFSNERKNYDEQHNSSLSPHAPLPVTVLVLP